MKTERDLKQFILLFFKGMLMGAADVVPGVSGGTIAFITGIYEELIATIKGFDLTSVRMLFKEGPVACWRHVNGSFLLVLLAGMVFSIAFIAGGVLFLLANYPVLIWAFFFGLIIASCWLVMSHVEIWSTPVLVAFIVGSVVAFVITSIAPAAVEPTNVMILVAGSVAICAMILPGISGSFILLLMGMYAPILAAVKGADLQIIGLFVLGCIIGITCFSRVLSWMFAHYKVLTLALLAGFMMGSLNKVWPWKYTVAYSINRHGGQVPLQQDNVLPWSYQGFTGEPAYLIAAIGLMLAGILVIMAMERSHASRG
ncbi:MAG: DUF368 domain-containing protein [Amphritea sp.]